MRILGLLLIFVSGTTGLVYEVVWLRMLSTALGSSSYTIAVVLAAYMLGLGLGGWAGGSLADRSRRPLRLYGLAQIAVCLSALAVPPLTGALDLVAGPGSLLELPVGLRTSARFLLAFVVLLVPCFFLGLSFPPFVRWLVESFHTPAHSDARVGWGVGLASSVNTLGAISGTGLAGFVLIAALGVLQSHVVACLGSLVAGGAACVLDRFYRRPEDCPMPAAARSSRTALPPAWAWMLFVSWFCLLGFEVIWTRMLSVLFASVSYAFCILLMVLFLGVSLGSALFGWLADRTQRPVRLLGLLLVATGISLVLPLFWIGAVSTKTGVTTTTFGARGLDRYFWQLAWDGLLLLFLPTLLFGGHLPVAARIVERLRGGVGRTVGALHFLGNVGAAAGSLAVGFVMIPLFGSFAKDLAALGGVLVLAGIAAAWTASEPKQRLLGLSAPAAGLALFAGLVALMPADTAFLLRVWTFQSPQRGNYRLGEHFDVLDYEEGPVLTATVVQDRQTAERLLYTDSFLVAGTGKNYAYMRVLGHLPALLAAELNRALVIGLGTGTTAGSLTLYPFRELDIAEISPEVCHAARRYFSEVNRAVLDRQDTLPAVTLHLEDGSQFLRATGKRFDLITVEPPSPYLTGSVHLYTREFYQRCLDRLAPGGVMCQWVPLHGVRPEDYRMILGTFARSFPASSVWHFRDATLLVGQPSKERFDLDRVRRRFREQPEARRDLEAIALGDPFSMLACFVAGSEGLNAFAAPPKAASEGSTRDITEDWPILEFYSGGWDVYAAPRDNLESLLRHREPIVPHLTGMMALPERRFEQLYQSRTDFFRWYVATHRFNLAEDPAAREGFASEAKLAAARALDICPDDAYVRNFLGRELAEAVQKETADRLENLTKLLTNPERGVRKMALEALGQYRGVSAASALAAIARTDPEAELRAAAAHQLSYFSHAPAVGALRDAVRADPDATVRQFAASSLGYLADWSAIPALIEALEDEDFNVRSMAYQSLRRLSRAEIAYDPEAQPLERREMTASWRDWWEEKEKELSRWKESN